MTWRTGTLVGVSVLAIAIGILMPLLLEGGDSGTRRIGESANIQPDPPQVRFANQVVYYETETFIDYRFRRTDELPETAIARQGRQHSRTWM